MPLPVQARGDALRFAVWVKPRAAQSRIVGLREEALEVAVAAPPVDGAANEELRKTLARALAVPKSAINVVGGQTGRNKLVEVTGLTPQALQSALSHWLC
jgi:uncharacterized protein (TIGR00251 family)